MQEKKVVGQGGKLDFKPPGVCGGGRNILGILYREGQIGLFVESLPSCGGGERQGERGMDTCQESPPKGGTSLLQEGEGERKTLFPLGHCRRCLILQLTRVLFFHPLLSLTHKKRPELWQKRPPRFRGRREGKVVWLLLLPLFSSPS